MLAALLALTSPVEACSQYFPGDPISSPRSGSVGPGFAVRPEGSWLNLTVLDSEGRRVEAEQDTLGQLILPAELPPGTYQLFDGATSLESVGDTGDPDSLTYEGAPSVTVELLSEQPALQEPEGRASLLDVRWDTGWVSEVTRPSCLEVRRRQHTFETVRVRVPASEQNGWALRVDDLSTSVFWWVGLDESSKEAALEQDLEASGRKQTGDLCLSIGLYDPQGALVEEESLPCISRAEAPGCSSGGARSGLPGGLLGGLVLLGLLLAGRRAPRAGAAQDS